MKRSSHRWLLIAICVLLLSLLLVAVIVVQGGLTRTVQPGDTAARLASRDGDRSGDTIAVAPLTTSSSISAGQTPTIPVSNTVEAMPAGKVSATDTCPCETLVIASPAQGMTVTSQLTMTGWVVGSVPDLVVAILDGSAQQIGRAYGSAQIGQASMLHSSFRSLSPSLPTASRAASRYGA